MISTMSFDWQRVGRAWTAIVDSLRSRDLLSSREAAELRFGAVRGSLARSFFGVPEYTLMPTFLTSPLFALSLWRTGSDARYKLLAPGLVQCRDVAVLLLVQIGVVEQPEAPELSLVLSHLAALEGVLEDGGRLGDSSAIPLLRRKMVEAVDLVATFRAAALNRSALLEDC